MAISFDDNTYFFNRRTHIEPMAMPGAHCHEDYELYFLEKGRTTYFIGNEIFMLEPGDMVFIPKKVFHKTDNGENTNVERILFSFDDSFVGEECKKYIDVLKEKRFIRIPREKLYKLRSLCGQIEDEDKKRHSGYEEMQKLCFRQMLLLISRYCSSTNITLSEAGQVVQSIARYISENPDDDLTLTALSKKFNLSSGHLSRLFKATAGISLSEYINITRITTAERLLTTTNLSITRIATECGFNDSNYFAAVFKKLKGTTPKKYSMQGKH